MIYKSCSESQYYIILFPSLMSLNGRNGKEITVSTGKLEAGELQCARKLARDPRSRLFSDSSDEIPKGILKNARIPTKRSASECIDDLSQIMADLDLNIHDLPKPTKFCTRHQFAFNEEEDEDEDDREREDNSEDENKLSNGNGSSSSNNKTNNIRFGFNGDLKECDCEINFGDNVKKPKKSVRFDERVYELQFASKLYDRRYFSKYRFSSRHHPPTNQQKSKKTRTNNNHHNSSKSHGRNEFSGSTVSLEIEAHNRNKPSKSQRAKQSKRDKKKLQKRKETNDTSSDDQGYCSSFHSFSD